MCGNVVFRYAQSSAEIIFLFLLDSRRRRHPVIDLWKGQDWCLLQHGLSQSSVRRQRSRSRVNHAQDPRPLYICRYDDVAVWRLLPTFRAPLRQDLGLLLLVIRSSFRDCQNTTYCIVTARDISRNQKVFLFLRFYNQAKVSLEP